MICKICNIYVARCTICAIYVSESQVKIPLTFIFGNSAYTENLI